MKIIRFLMTIVLAGALIPADPATAQGTTGLHVSAMPGFPIFPGDTAYEGQFYAFDIKVKNNTNQTLNNLTINLTVDSNTTIIISSPAITLNSNDSIILNVTQYPFTQPQFKAGNNIVVVWPSVNGLTVPIDSFITDVYFVPLNSLGGNQLNDDTFELFPSPASHTLQLSVPHENEVEYVRIYSATGQLVSELAPMHNLTINVDELKPGTYYLEVESVNRITRKRFIKF